MEHCGVSVVSPSIDEYLDLYGEACGSIGIPYSIYWHGTEDELTYYIKAYERKYQTERSIFETEAWILGVYTANAVASCLGDFDYPNEPLKFYGEQSDSEREITENELEERKRKETAMIMAKMSQFM